MNRLKVKLLLFLLVLHGAFLLVLHGAFPLFSEPLPTIGIFPLVTRDVPSHIMAQLNDQVIK